jgi:hypothetical protein
MGGNGEGIEETREGYICLPKSDHTSFLKQRIMKELTCHIRNPAPSVVNSLAILKTGKALAP